MHTHDHTRASAERAQDSHASYQLQEQERDNPSAVNFMLEQWTVGSRRRRNSAVSDRRFAPDCSAASDSSTAPDSRLAAEAQQPRLSLWHEHTSDSATEAQQPRLSLWHEHTSDSAAVQSARAADDAGAGTVEGARAGAQAHAGAGTGAVSPRELQEHCSLIAKWSEFTGHDHAFNQARSAAAVAAATADPLSLSPASLTGASEDSGIAYIMSMADSDYLLDAADAQAPYSAIPVRSAGVTVLRSAGGPGPAAADRSSPNSAAGVQAGITQLLSSDRHGAENDSDKTELTAAADSELTDAHIESISKGLQQLELALEAMLNGTMSREQLQQIRLAEQTARELMLSNDRDCMAWPELSQALYQLLSDRSILDSARFEAGGNLSLMCQLSALPPRHAHGEGGAAAGRTRSSLWGSGHEQIDTARLIRNLSSIMLAGQRMDRRRNAYELLQHALMERRCRREHSLNQFHPEAGPTLDKDSEQEQRKTRGRSRSGFKSTLWDDEIESGALSKAPTASRPEVGNSAAAGAGDSSGSATAATAAAGSTAGIASAGGTAADCSADDAAAAGSVAAGAAAGDGSESVSLALKDSIRRALNSSLPGNKAVLIGAQSSDAALSVPVDHVLLTDTVYEGALQEARVAATDIVHLNAVFSQPDNMLECALRAAAASSSCRQAHFPAPDRKYGVAGALSAAGERPEHSSSWGLSSMMPFGRRRECEYLGAEDIHMLAMALCMKDLTSTEVLYYFPEVSTLPPAQFSRLTWSGRPVLSSRPDSNHHADEKAGAAAAAGEAAGTAAAAGEAGGKAAAAWDGGAAAVGKAGAADGSAACAGESRHGSLRSRLENVLSVSTMGAQIRKISNVLSHPVSKMALDNMIRLYFALHRDQGLIYSEQYVLSCEAGEAERTQSLIMAETLRRSSGMVMASIGHKDQNLVVTLNTVSAVDYIPDFKSAADADLQLLLDEDEAEDDSDALSEQAQAGKVVSECGAASAAAGDGVAGEGSSSAGNGAAAGGGHESMATGGQDSGLSGLQMLRKQLKNAQIDGSIMRLRSMADYRARQGLAPLEQVLRSSERREGDEQGLYGSTGSGQERKPVAVKWLPLCVHALVMRTLLKSSVLASPERLRRLRSYTSEDRSRCGAINIPWALAVHDMYCHLASETADHRGFKARDMDPVTQSHNGMLRRYHLPQLIVLLRCLDNLRHGHAFMFRCSCGHETYICDPFHNRISGDQICPFCGSTISFAQ